MSTTTQILYNSPALHALKRDQLVKLCKIHSVKANGKTTELIERLKERAAELRGGGGPSDGEEETEGADNNEDLEGERATGKGGWNLQMPRPSEQWEVMDSIQELEENSSQGTLSSLRTLGSQGANASEFGSRGSKSSTSTVGSSIKALANSLGLKRFPSTSSKTSTHTSAPADDLATHSTPYSSLPPSTLPRTDNITFTVPTSYTSSDSTPLPGHILRPGAPAPINARLSLGLRSGTSTPTKDQETTTIRLVGGKGGEPPGVGGTPQLRPFATSFDLVLGSPSTAAGTVWPPISAEEKVYPALPIDKGKSQDREADAMEVDMPGAFSFAAGPSSGTPAPAKRAPSNRTPLPLFANDIFSPKPAPSGGLTVPGPTPAFIFGSPLPQHRRSNAQFADAAQEVLAEMNRRLQEEGVEGVSINLLTDKKARVGDGGTQGGGAPRSVDAGKRYEKVHEQVFGRMEGIDGWLGRKEGGGKKRKSDVLEEAGAGRRPIGRAGTRVISGGRRSAVRIIEDGQQVERREKRARVDGEVKGVDQNVSEKEHNNEDKVVENAEEEERKRKERDAIRRKLEISKAKRRSSVGAKGRMSIGRTAAKPKPTSRFGFISSAAKSLVSNVWSRNKTTTSSTVPKSKVPVAAPTSSNNTSKPAPSKPSLPRTRSSSIASRTTAPVRVASSSSSKILKPPVAKGDVKGTIGRARSPIPAFGAGGMGTRSSGSSIGVRARPVGTSTNTSTSRSGSLAGASSLGVRGSTAGSRMSSVGTRSSGAGTRGSASRGDASSGGPAGSQRMSRLFAPTASSLAKMQASKKVVDGEGVGQGASDEGDRPAAAAAGDDSVRKPGGIFSTPLARPPTSGIPVLSPTKDTGVKAVVGLKPKDKTLAGRKPRISRSKVIARLASQRAAPDGASGTGGSTRVGVGYSGVERGVGKGRVRSSLDARIGRGEGDVLMSARKRARRSEAARRRSRVTGDRS